MDTLAAIALGTEPPLPSIVAGEPYKDHQVLQPQIWRQILGVSLWNCIVILCVVFFVPLADPTIKYNMVTSPDDGNAEGEAKRRHMTYVFNIFVLLQIFN